MYRMPKYHFVIRLMRRFLFKSTLTPINTCLGQTLTLIFGTLEFKTSDDELTGASNVLRAHSSYSLLTNSNVNWSMSLEYKCLAAITNESAGNGNVSNIWNVSQGLCDKLAERNSCDWGNIWEVVKLAIGIAFIKIYLSKLSLCNIYI